MLQPYAHTPQQPLKKKKKNERYGLDLLISAMEEVRIARRDLGWGVDELAMRFTMLVLPKKKRQTTGVPREATPVDMSEEVPIDRVSDWERLLRWAHASYGWNERVVAKRTGDSHL